MRSLTPARILVALAIVGIPLAGGIVIGTEIANDDDAVVRQARDERPRLDEHGERGLRGLLPPERLREFHGRMRDRFERGFRFRGAAPPRELDPELLELKRRILEAVAKEAPGIAKPLIDDALRDGRISEAQAQRLRQRIAALADGRFPLLGPHLPGLGHGR